LSVLQLAQTIKRVENMKGGDKYYWTKHSLYKMRHYRLSAQRVKRIIRYPIRVEEAIVPNLIAAMQPACAGRLAGNKTYSEIWTIYKPVKNKKQIKIITAWRYPGKSPARNPIPREILDEIKNVIS